MSAVCRYMSRIKYMKLMSVCDGHCSRLDFPLGSFFGLFALGLREIELYRRGMYMPCSQVFALSLGTFIVTCSSASAR